MKKRALPTLICFSLFVLACKKDMNPGSTTPVSLTGTWNWISSYSDVPLSDSNPLTPANSGITESIRFDENKKWLHTLKGVADDSGTYKLGHGTYTSQTVFNYDSVVFSKNGRKQGSTAYLVSGDTLTFSSFAQGYVGGGAKQWVKSTQ